tara:strand:- start:564 stop:1115 length:552 start_codon:yes stop_codon:yes gene_type:complete
MDKNGVISDVKTWIDDFVTKPNPLLNNMPPCPYAKQAILDKKIDIQVPDEGSISYNITKTIETWNKDLDIVLLVYDPKKHTGELFEKIIINANGAIDSSFVLLDDHPDNVENINGVHMNNGKYAIVFIQRTKKLQEAHEYLKTKTNYYDVWNKENLDDVVNWRLNRLKEEEILPHPSQEDNIL